jgi:nitrogen fixation NifU-like protein
MPILMTNDMMREIIMDHYSKPRFKKTPTDLSSFQTIRMESTSCIDKISVYVKVVNNVIVEAYFDGIGCAISTASTDIMCQLITGKSKDEANLILKNYLAMIHEEHYDENILDEALVFMNTYKQPARIKCATIGWNALEELIK